jgi:hypothetical protein
VPLQDGDISPGDEPYVPGGHNGHVANVIEFDVVPGSAYEPTGHDIVPLQADELSPEVAPKVPGGQKPHVAGSDVSEDFAPARAYLPAGHETGPHVDGSDVTLDIAPDLAYVPAGQLTVPLQDGDKRPGDEPKVPAGQDKQPEVIEVAPAYKLAEYCPVRHTTDPLHIADVLPPLPNMPGGHNVQFEPV